MSDRAPRWEFLADEGDALQAVEIANLPHQPLLIAGSEKGAVQVWDLLSGEKIAEADSHSGPVYRVAVVMLDGRPHVASASRDHTVVIWDYARTEVLHRLEHPDAVYDVVAGTAKGERVLVTSCEDGHVRLFAAATGELRWEASPESGAALGAGHADLEGGITAVVYEKGGAYLVHEAQAHRRLDRRVDGFQEVAVGAASDGRPLVVAGDRVGSVWIWGGADLDISRRLTPHRGWVLGVAITTGTDGTFAASSGEDGRVCVHAVERGEIVDEFMSHEGGVPDVAWGAVDGRLVLATGSNDGPARVWELELEAAAPAEPEPRDQVEWLADAPSREDLLGRSHIARALATRLKRLSADDPTTSFLIHVDGPWGAGKSTVLELLADELGEGWMLVRFDAWRQSRVGPPWWALLMSLRSAVLREHGRWGRARLRLREASGRARRAGAPYVLSLLLLIVAAAAIFVAIKPPQVDAKSLGDVARTVSAVVAALATLWAGARLAGRFLFWDSATGARVYEQSAQDPMERLADHFAWLIGVAHKRALFLIDDLDRCNEQYVVELLDAVQTLVRDAGSRPTAPESAGARAPYFIVAADGAWIRRSYETAYESFGDVVGQVGRPLGYLFLDKIFQITVQVPGMSAKVQERYLSRLLLGRQDGAQPTQGKERERVEAQIRGSSTEGQVLAALASTTAEVRATVAATAVDKLTAPEVEAATEHALERFAPLLEPNPRAMKRFVNAYSVARACAVLEDQLVDRDVLAAWTILRMRWPQLADHLRSSPRDIEPLADANRGPPPTAPEALAPLFADPGVRRVVAFDEERRLTPDLIDQLCGRTTTGDA